MLKELLNIQGMAIDIETTSESGKRADNLHFKKCEIVCIGFAWRDGEEIKSTVWCPDDLNRNRDLVIELLTTKKLIGHNLKFDLKVISKHFNLPDLEVYFDTMIASKLLDENGKHGLKDLGLKHFKAEWGNWKNYKQWCREKELDYKDDIYKPEYTVELMKYCAKDAEITYKLAELFEPKLNQQNLTNLFDTEIEVVNIFLKSELYGVQIDVMTLQKLHTKYSRHVERVQNWIYRHTQEPFNINSSQQLGTVLYDLKKLPVINRSKKTNEPSTDVRTLTQLSKDGSRFVDGILLYRHWEMLRRHIEKLLKEEINGRVYPTFNTIGTETGRFSCKEPNLQQIPSKTKESRRIREAFVGQLIVADYSNIELRILAHYTRDPKLLDVYKDGGSGDLHSATAKSIFKLDCSLEDVKEEYPKERSHAKTINFGICYGMGPQKLSDSLGITEELAKSYIDKWYETYKNVQPWKDMIVNTMKKYGFVRSLGGRKRRIKFQGLSNYDSFGAERESINFVIQGSSADITKAAIVALKDEKILLQVHDELVIEQGERSIGDIKSIMENVTKLKVPIPVDIKACSNWSEGK